MAIQSTDNLIIERGGTHYKAPVSQLPSGGGSLPAGGTAGQVLTKLSAANGDATWQNSPSGFNYGLSDVIRNGHFSN